jgi:hypothetical protein
LGNSARVLGIKKVSLFGLEIIFSYGIIIARNLFEKMQGFFVPYETKDFIRLRSNSFRI